MKLIAATLTCVLVVASQAAFAQAGPKLPGSTATLPAVPLQMGSSNDIEIMKLKQEIANIKKDYAADMLKFKNDIAALNDQLAALTSTYKNHTHDYFLMKFSGMVPTKVTCFVSDDCKNGIFYDKLIPNGGPDTVSKPHN